MGGQEKERGDGDVQRKLGNMYRDFALSGVNIEKERKGKDMDSINCKFICVGDEFFVKDLNAVSGR